jgi:hypothetical protein
MVSCTTGAGKADIGSFTQQERRMTFGNRTTHKQTSTMTIVLAMAASVLGSSGCEQAEPEVAQVTTALGSSQAQQTVDNWTELTQMVSGGNYLLTTDLNASGQSWNPIDFTGTFDGGGKIISNLTVNSTGSGAGFFRNMSNAIVRNVRFTNLNVKDSFMAGGIAAIADNSLIELVGVQGSVGAPTGSSSFTAGGLVASAGGTTIRRSFMKGSVSGAYFSSGGLVGFLGNGAERGLIYQSYAWANVTTNPASDFSQTGGIAGQLSGASIQEVYAVGNITGRNKVGGLVGDIQCDESNPFVLNHGVYRGDVVDSAWTPSGGWAGTYGSGTVDNCASRFDQLIWDRSRDGSSNFGAISDSQKSASNSGLTSPTTAGGGVYAYADNTFLSSIWAAGSNVQHHVLQNMPGGLSIQPRCVNSSGVAITC